MAMRKISSKRLFIDVLYILMIFFDALAAHIPMGNYLDEGIAVFSIIILLAYAVRKKCISRLNAALLISSIAAILMGIISNLMYGYVMSADIIIRDIVGIFKFFICFKAADIYLKGKKYYAMKDIIKLTKIIIVMIFTFGVISLFINIGMGDSIRFGIRSYKFIYSFYNVLVFNETVLIAVLMTERKSNIGYYIMAFATLLFTLRTKGIIVIILFVAFRIMQARKNNPILYGSILSKGKYIIPAAIVLVMLTKNKIMTYISFGKYESIRIGALVTELSIMCDCFPFGSGFGTYGTSLSYSTGSILYDIYNSINYSMMMNPEVGYASMSDTFWPAIYAQLGIIGFLLYVYGMFICFKSIKIDAIATINQKTACIFILTYMLVISLTEAVYLNPTGVTGPLLIAIIMNMRIEGNATSGKINSIH